MPGLGRRPAPDDRDAAFPMAAVLPPAPVRGWRYWWLPSARLRDQRATSSCVGHAWHHYAVAGPVTQPDPPDPFRVYREAQQVDEWPGRRSVPRGGVPSWLTCCAACSAGSAPAMAVIAARTT